MQTTWKCGNDLTSDQWHQTPRNWLDYGQCTAGAELLAVETMHVARQHSNTHTRTHTHTHIKTDRHGERLTDTYRDKHTSQPVHTLIIDAIKNFIWLVSDCSSPGAHCKYKTGLVITYSVVVGPVQYNATSNHVLTSTKTLSIVLKEENDNIIIIIIRVYLNRPELILSRGCGLAAQSWS